MFTFLLAVLLVAVGAAIGVVAHAAWLRHNGTLFLAGRIALLRMRRRMRRAWYKYATRYCPLVGRAHTLFFAARLVRLPGSGNRVPACTLGHVGHPSDNY